MLLRFELLLMMHLNCAQTLLVRHAARCGLTEEQALLMGEPLGRGFERGETCGLVLAALIVMGLHGSASKRERFFAALDRPEPLACPVVQQSAGGCDALASEVYGLLGALLDDDDALKGEG